MATTADLKKGAVIKHNNDPCLILDSQHRTPGNLRAFYQVKMRNLRNGKLSEDRFRSGETLEFLRVEKKEYQYLYKDGDDFVFMNKDNYEQINVQAKNVGESAAYMKEASDVFITFNDTEILSVVLPQHAVLRVLQTEPGVKGDSVNNIMKPATMETGAVIQVPIFVNEGDLIRVDTENGGYMERVKDTN
jgi:elongation factor P